MYGLIDLVFRIYIAIAIAIAAVVFGLGVLVGKLL